MGPRFEQEHDAGNHATLRSELIRQGGVRAEHITNGRIAGDAYHLLCSLARIVAPVRALDQIEECLDE